MDYVRLQVIVLTLEVTALTYLSAGVNIWPCPVQVIENTSSHVVTCSAISSNDKVNWLYTNQNSQNFPLASCDLQGLCDNDNKNFVASRRPMDSLSTLTIVNVTRGLLADSNITCATEGSQGVTTGSHRCPVDITYPADVTSCTIYPIKSDTTWNVSGMCTISKVFSSMQQYSCQLRWQTKMPDIYIVSNTTYSPILNNATLQYASGTCSYTGPLPIKSDTYQFSVLPFPGTKPTVAGNITVVAPTLPPGISCTHSGRPSQYIPENTNLTCTCTSTDLGQPQGRLVVYREDILLVVGNYSLTSLTLTLEKISRNANGTTVVCAVDWATFKDKRSDPFVMVVAYAPQKPNITYKGHPYPFLSRDAPTLYCLFPGNTDRGNPPAILTWPGNQVQEDKDEVTLTLPSLTAADNRRRIQCAASNAFTQWNNSSVVTEMLLDVYYPPNVNVTPLTANQCEFGITSNTCIVREGERVHVNCTADSNPRPDIITWTQRGHTNTILNLTAHRNTDMVHTCNVTTRTVGEDHRLPLNGSRQLTVLVTYASSLGSLTINTHFFNLTVNEGDVVTITCAAAGRPTPAIKLTTYGVHVAALNKGGVTVDHLVTLTSTPTRATCEMSGSYTCNVTNDLGAINSQSVELYVACKPRLDPDATNSQPGAEYNYVGHPIYMNFPLLAYPAPHNHTLFYKNMSALGVSDFRPARESLYSVMCEETDRVFRMYCTLIIDNVTATDKGQYQVLFENHNGPFNFTFQLDVKGTNKVEETTPGWKIGAAVGGGLGVAAVVIIAAMFTIFFIKKRRASERPTGKRERSLSRKTDSRTTRESESPGEMSEYSDLRMSDVGQASIYTQLGPSSDKVNRGTADVYQRQL